ncbi:hypothetical protein, partial [uncultured Desulfovibrio sp.]|uniref:hypothetical protein n=1 Tax=uncultured Desulfovibrio sp. TaxID=167968 RepID=UPI002603B160
LPAVAVNIGDSFGTQVAVDGQKFAALATFRIAAAGTSVAGARTVLLLVTSVMRLVTPVFGFIGRRSRSLHTALRLKRVTLAE